MMDELIGRVRERTGLDEATSGKAVGIILALVRKHGDQAKVARMFAMMPGADALAAKHGTSAGGFFGALSGAIGGGAMMAFGQLSAAGLSMDQARCLGDEVLGFAREKCGDELVQDVAASVGLEQYV